MHLQLIIFLMASNIYIMQAKKELGSLLDLGKILSTTMHRRFKILFPTKIPIYKTIFVV